MSFIGSTLRLDVFDDGVSSTVGDPLVAVIAAGGAPEFSGSALATLDASVDVSDGQVIVEFLSDMTFDALTRNDEALGFTLTLAGDDRPLIVDVRSTDDTTLERLSLDRRESALLFNVGRDGGWSDGDRVVVDVVKASCVAALRVYVLERDRGCFESDCRFVRPLHLLQFALYRSPDS